MSNENDLIEYDETDAIKYIRKQLPQELKSKLEDDDIFYVVDLMYEYYEKNGLLEEDSTVEIDETVIAEYVTKKAKKENVELSEDEIIFIVQGELSYCESIGIFE